MAQQGVRLAHFEEFFRLFVLHGELVERFLLPQMSSVMEPFFQINDIPMEQLFEPSFGFY